MNKTSRVIAEKKIPNHNISCDKIFNRLTALKIIDNSNFFTCLKFKLKGNYRKIPSSL